MYDHLLKEDGHALLKEDGGFILLEFILICQKGIGIARMSIQRMNVSRMSNRRCVRS